MTLETVPFDFDDELISRTQCDKTPRVRVYQWQETSVVIGRGGRQELELKIKNIAADRVMLYKRPGGGCSVVLDPGNVIISVALPLPGLGNIKSTFAQIGSWLRTSLARCGIPNVVQRGVSDLAVGDRKIGGSCVYRTKGLLYYSTTLLVDHDPELVDRYLKHPPREPEYRQLRPHAQFMASLNELGVIPVSDSWPIVLRQELESGLDQLAQITGCQG